METNEEHQAESAERQATRNRIDLELAERLLKAGVERVLRPAPGTIVNIPLDGSPYETVVNKGDLAPARWMIFQGTQARYARQWRRRLELFTQTIGTARRQKFRMIVVSAGLVAIGLKRTTHSELRTVLRTIAADPILRQLGLKLHFANVEETIHQIFDDVLYHLHSHLLVEASYVPDRWRHLATGRDLDPAIETDAARLRRLSKARRDGRETEGYERRSGWGDVIARLRELNTLKAYAHDAGPVENFDEFLKYMTKSQTSTYVDDEYHNTNHRRLCLFDLSHDELAEYCESVKWTNRFQAYGEFKDFLKDIRFHTYEHDPDTGEVLGAPRKVRNRIVSLEDGTLVLTPAWSPDVQPMYADVEIAGEPADVVLGLAVLPNPAGELVVCARTLNPSPESLDDVRNLIEKRGLQELAIEHAAILAARRAERARYMKHTEQLSCDGAQSTRPQLGASTLHSFNKMLT